MSFSTAIKTLKGNYSVKLQTKEDTKDVVVSYSRDAIDYIDNYLMQAIKNFNEETVKDDSMLYEYITNSLNAYEANLPNTELKNTQQKSELVVNLSYVKKHFQGDEKKVKVKNQELVMMSAFAEKLLKMLLDETSKVTVGKFKKSTVHDHHVKLAIIDAPVLLKYYKNPSCETSEVSGN